MIGRGLGPLSHCVRILAPKRSLRVRWWSLSVSCAKPVAAERSASFCLFSSYISEGKMAVMAIAEVRYSHSLSPWKTGKLSSLPYHGFWSSSQISHAPFVRENSVLHKLQLTWLRIEKQLIE